MPKYAVVAVIEAEQPADAWEKVGGVLLAADPTRKEIAYVGAPWDVPSTNDEFVEFGTDAISLTLNGRRVALVPAA